MRALIRDYLARRRIKKLLARLRLGRAISDAAIAGLQAEVDACSAGSGQFVARVPNHRRRWK